jgi:hypothetical protein
MRNEDYFFPIRNRYEQQDVILNRNRDDADLASQHEWINGEKNTASKRKRAYRFVKSVRPPLVVYLGNF